MPKNSSGKKRIAVGGEGPRKKRKLEANNGRQSGSKSVTKPKQKAFERPTIALPSRPDEDGSASELSEEDMQFYNDQSNSAAFLQNLDYNGILRSKKETQRLHELSKPTRRKTKTGDLPSLESDGEDNSDDWNSSIEGEDDSSVESASEDFDSEEEMPYEKIRRPAWEAQDDEVTEEIEHLPIKLKDGQIKKSIQKPTTFIKPRPPTPSDSELSEEEVVEEVRIDDVTTGARFGRLAVVDILTMPSRKARIRAAKDQIGDICQEIISDPENSAGLLKRLNTFASPTISSPSHPDPVENDVLIRKLTFLSQLSVFKDIIPGYRIRSLTDKEKNEKVSQMVARTRDWEQSLVGTYQVYLRHLEAEVKGKSELAEASLQCLCSLAAEVTHFNFRVNILTCIVAFLSRKSWNQLSDLCLDTLNQIFKDDLTGVPSLEIVRVLNRMIKERNYQVSPNVLSCLLRLRLKTELNVRASETTVDRKESTAKQLSKGRAAQRRLKGKKTEQPHLSKRAAKIMKERKEIQREFKNAEAEVDVEERANTHTETLKLIFVLYFRVLKNPTSTPLLPAALRGIAKFAHLVNIDFFRDLLEALKAIIERETADPGEDEKDPKNIENRLLCVVTAFELLSGQGEALNIDLADFLQRLYTVILPLSCVSDIEVVASHSDQSISDMLFRALHIVFSPKFTSGGGGTPPWTLAAFAKRLLIAALHWPPSSSLRAIEFARSAIARDGRLEALLSTEDRTVDGVYRGDVEDPQLSNPFASCLWELHFLRERHADSTVREEARKLALYVRNG